MKLKASFKSTKARVTLFSSVVLLVSCGNQWMSSSDRENTPSAMLKKAMKADDKGDYDTSIALYRQMLEKDPTNDNVRIRLAYALNGKAGLGFFEVVDKMNNSTATATSTSTSTGTSQNSSLGVISKVVGLTDSEKSSIVDTVNANSAASMSEIRQKSILLTTLHESWLAICRVLPSEIIEKHVNSDAIVKVAANGDECKGGLPASQVKASAKFAAALQLIAEGMILYQTVIDSDGDSQLDLLKKADTVNSSIATIQGQISGATGSQITTLLSDLNQSMAELKSLGDAFKSEAISLALADFSMVADIIADMEGLPDDLKANIRSTVDKFSEAKNKMNDFSQAGKRKATTGSSGTAANDPVKATEKATQAFNDLNTKISTLSGQEKTKAQAQMTQACTNFDSVKSIYNLPDDTQKPAGCATTNLTSLSSQDHAEGNFELEDNYSLATESLSDEEKRTAIVNFVDFGNNIRPK